MATSEERKLELERKKQRLAEMREDKRRREEERRRMLLRRSPQENGALPALPKTFSQKDLEDILKPLGIPAQPHIERPVTPTGVASNAENATGSAQCVVGSGRLQNLVLAETQMITIAPKESACYCKTTQTDDDRVSAGEFSLGSQEFDYDEEMTMMDKHLDINFDESPTREIANLLPNFHFGARHTHEPMEEKKEEDQKVPDLSEEEKLQILSSQKFKHFFDFKSKVMERHLAEEVDVFVDYTRNSSLDEKADSGEKLILSRVFVDEKWTAGRCVTGIDFCEQHPELVAVSYDQNPESPLDPMGVIQVWNCRFKKPTAEFTFYCQSRVTSVAFAKFHPNLIMGGCYSGQICMWDNRISKRTPVNKSPLSSQAHTHPVFSMAVIGSQNAHNLISISTDGRLCSWSVDNLNQPIDVIDLSWKQKQVTCTSMSFALDDVNNFVVGSEEGSVYTASRHGNKGGINDGFEGHTAPITRVDSHKAVGVMDLSHLFLSCSLDWTVKLWSSKETRALCSLEKHDDYVMDVAWSPVHPAVFTSADAAGNLFVWNLNEDSEAPVTRLKMQHGVGVRKMMWMHNGQQLTVGDEKGNLWLYDVHESLTNCKPDEWSKLARTLRDIKQAREEAEELLEAAGRIGTSSSSASLISVAQSASNPIGNLSPRQQW
ncbi:Cytoplasmic dynein 1 intermediate chain 1 [Toxocara canis]|uniref:Cytoplasmic dynein 1 intermediate chain 1 n=1 Tax=Toxocara canis TaxID=6265 RepID=A0A0B2V0R7_TOXCA|nr:Cytoplasmic dynein 1 intermediate chain 1 [Toxocara canis]